MKKNMVSLLAANGIKCKIYTSLIVMSLLVPAMSGKAHAVTPWYASGSSHVLALKPDGTVWAVGSNNYGQLGVSSARGEINEPVQVSGLRNITAVAAGGSHSVALRQDGTVWTWGYNGSGQLGNGNKTSSNAPLQVSGIRDVVAIAAGYGHVAALKRDGTVWAWGSNHSGQVGKDSKGIFVTPVQVSELKEVSAIAAGAYHTAALKVDGTVWTWGFNGSGQIGNGSTESSNTPIKVSGLNNIIAIAAGNNHMIALQNDGTAWNWGSNYASQLGNGSASAGSTLPVQVSGLSGVMDITARVNHNLALMQNGTVMAWGDKGSGEWGNGMSMNGSSTPVMMRGVSSPTLVAGVGNPSTLVNKHAGTAFAGGDNATVQPGNELVVESSTAPLSANIRDSGAVVTADASHLVWR